MTRNWTIGGVPASILHDGWWITDDQVRRPRGGGQRGGVAAGWRIGVLAALVALADGLFYRQTPGVSLALFALVVFAAATLPVVRPKAGPWALLALSVLPVIDFVQPLSVAFLAGGLLTAIGWAHLGAAPLTTILAATAGIVRTLPRAGLRDAMALAADLPHRPGTARLPGRLWRDWAFPLGGALVLAGLLAEANPILGRWLADLADVPTDPVETALRIGFWLGMALLIWPLLVADRAPPRPLHLPALPARLGLTPNAVTHALIGFNAILGVQTLLDARYLWSGFSAPAGMTLAEYAHRGAYPLLAAALLAGAFALAARPYLGERRLLKPLLLLWLAQNVVLALSAVYRLDLYVGAYGLTYLRVHAGIWMLLVAAGLALTLGQVAAKRSNGWLLARCAALGLGTLYLCAFVNFAAVIAHHNLRDANRDETYLCSLGPTAALPRNFCCDGDCMPAAPRIDGWRDWGYRNWRVLRYLESQTEAEAPREDPRRG